jgi:isoleucyl-tRNA synthetase
MADSPQKSPRAASEERILSRWKEKGVFKKTVNKPATEGPFVFYEGPPTANGRPGVHHLESRAFKDLIPRYKTMRGFSVRRKAGWDTHGLPVELEVEKKLGLSSKKAIEEYGIDRFNDACKESVWTYVDEWKRFTERIGYWVDLDDPYVTYDPRYIESVWNIVKHVHDRGLLYKDYKVVPWCPRCGTALSSHELAQGYADVKDLSVYAKFKVVGEEDTYILAWTTTPWTLPGNVALAVNENETYVRVKNYALEINTVPLEVSEPKGGKAEFLILAKKRFEALKEKNSLPFKNPEVVEEFPGKDLVGKEYEPLFAELQEHMQSSELRKEEFSNWKNGWKVYPASFVTMDDGVGVVHTAVMYGQDDFDLGTKFNLPKLHTVHENGLFVSGVAPEKLWGRFVKDEDVAVDIIKDLAHRGLLFHKEKYEHSYPFCWRCKTPLIYYARDSWYIRMSALRDELVASNKEISWQPEHVRDGRFGEWLREIKDWAISRERYWGTPLPIWTGEDGSIEVIGSVAELRERTVSRGNSFVFVRHGEAGNNTASVCSSDVTDGYSLTEKGKSDITALAESFSSRGITTIYVSPFTRTRETAEILRAQLGLPEASIIVDDRLREYDFGDFSGKPFTDFLAYESENMHSYTDVVSGGESYRDAKVRFGDFLYDVDEKHAGETVLVVTHGIGLETIPAVLSGADDAEAKRIIDEAVVPPGGTLEFAFTPIPHDAEYRLDLHRPFIDAIRLTGKSGSLMRVKEVMDVWFDSGAMPFAQDHWPFSGSEIIGGYPADYISEAVDQTRGWFYTLHAIGALLGKSKAYKNVICLGHVLDKDGQKMSKSRGNALDPWTAIDQYGADVLRFWMYSVNQPGDSKNFDPKTVEDVSRKVFGLMENVTKFYQLQGGAAAPDAPAVRHPLDRWVKARVDAAAWKVSESLDAYQVFEASREIRDLIADVSQWYVRRSRDRFKDGGDDAADALGTLGWVIRRVAILLAPFTPFFAEELFDVVKKDGEESVHLAEWSAPIRADESILQAMESVRTSVSLALEARARAGIKIRQPLASLTLKNADFMNDSGLVSIVMDEVNVKEVRVDALLDAFAVLDTVITEELRTEGMLRDAVRAIQEARKSAGLVPADRPTATLYVPQADIDTYRAMNGSLVKECGLASLEISVGEGDALSATIG